MRAAKIVLVEDNANDAELTLAALAEHHLANEIVVLPDGAIALDYFHRRGEWANRGDGEPLLVLLDLKMPRVDGLEVLRDLKNDPALRTVPVVVLTSSKEEPDLRRAYALGVNGYVVKPVSFPKFTDVVKHLGMYWLAINEPPPASRS